ncbi:MAG: YifB family Mg chelatase-like AAA ATPase [Bifidobacteriaceae bacterium]|nr:YifB family Mg chelatase-like AAA ATPase [Bifidobacteriaceae bacterium]
MKVARAWSVALVGMEGALVEVEAAIASGLPRTVLVGLPDAALYEARDRCRAAMNSVKFGWPSDPVTINLSPAFLPKTGTHYDLSIVAAVGAAKGLCPVDALDRRVLLGELGLDGRVRAVRGLLPAVLAATQHGFERIVVPAGQMREAALVEGLEVVGVEDVMELFSVLCGAPGASPPPPLASSTPDEPEKDLADVAGQLEAKWALEVAAAGRHHLFLHGPPGVGKTLLAERLPGVLPDLVPEESREVSAIHSLVGHSLDAGLITRPPYSSPHHSVSLPALVGGGHKVAQPGAVSLAHRGVLFLDEAPEFSPRLMDSLRVPLESGRIVIARSAATTVYPARFQMVLAANPCPCGMAFTAGAQCHCAPMAVRRYGERVSMPIRDRVDIHQHLKPLRKSFLKLAMQASEPSAAVAERVRLARERQRRRLRPYGLQVNGEIPGGVLRKQLPLPEDVERLEHAVLLGELSARGVDKVLRLAWTIADLAGAYLPDGGHLDTALAMRRGE